MVQQNPSGFTLLMPLIDLNNSIIPSPARDADVFIVGAGAAGIFLAHELKRYGARVTLIETGHRDLDGERQALNVVENTGKELRSAVNGRNRAIGGTTRTWGGQSLEFSEMDFEKRDWVRESGWPIKKFELQTDYAKANAFMGIDTLDYKNDILKLLNRPDLFPAYETGLVYHFSKWAPQANFFRLGKDLLDRHVNVLFNAHVRRLNVSRQKDCVESIEICNFEGKQFTLIVPRLVLAAGALETVRLLLNSSHQCDGGIGNHSGWLGKCFMEHPCLEIGKINNTDSHALQEWFAPRIFGGRKYSVRISPTESWQRKHHLLNISASVMFSYGDDFDPYQEIRSIVRQYNTKHFGKLVTRIPWLVNTAIRSKLSGWVYKPHATGLISLMCEQEPLASSRLSLGKGTDIFGEPRLSVNWNISDLTWETILKFSNEIVERIATLGLGEIDRRINLSRENTSWRELVSDVNHHMGGARMSDNAESGVVSRGLNVWGIPNLFVCSTAVFPTSSHSNPTLTLLALASRLSSEIKMQSQSNTL